MGMKFMEDRYYRLNDLIGKKNTDRLIPIARSTVWAWVAAGKFPQPVRLGPRTTAWDGKALNAWVQELENAA